MELLEVGLKQEIVMDAETLKIIITVLAGIAVPVCVWFASFTTGRLREMEGRIERIQNSHGLMVTRDEFNNRMDVLTNLILDNLPRTIVDRRLADRNPLQGD